MIKYKVWIRSFDIEEIDIVKETKSFVYCNIGFVGNLDLHKESKNSKEGIYFDTREEATQYVLSVASEKQAFYNKVIEDNSPSCDYKYTKHDIDIAKLIYFQEVVVRSIVELCEKKVQVLGEMKKKPKALEFYINLLDYYMPIDEKLKGNTDNNSTALQDSLTPNQMNTFARAVFTALELIEKHGHNRSIWNKIENMYNLVHANNYVANRAAFNTGFGG